MNIIAKRTLVQFWTRHPQARALLVAWHAVMLKSEFESPKEVKARFGANVDFLADNRAIFDIGGNKYRLIVRFSYTYKVALIKFVGTHAEYDRIDPETV
jgi:mRNA interferase HigB